MIKPSPPSPRSSLISLARTGQRTLLVAGTCLVALWVGATGATAASYHLEYAFAGGTDGAGPNAAVTKRAGKLYGTTQVGGAHGSGVVYVFDPATGAETVLHSFGSSGDGSLPSSAMINVGGKLYGTTSYGGVAGFGTVYSFDPTSGAEVVVYSFAGGSDGATPLAGLIDVGGILYGTTTEGGSTHCTFECGVVFSFSPTTGAEKVLHVFQGGRDGQNPASDLIDVGGILYGTTESGGSKASDGTVFSVDPTTGEESVVYAFKGGGDGRILMAGLVVAGGIMFGTTEEGGVGCSNFGCGTVFSVDPASGAKKTIYEFQGGSDGDLPSGDLIDVGGTMYGVTEDGGHQRGTVFSLNPATGVETVLYAFRGVDGGRAPEGALFSDGKTLWGTTSEGGGSPDCNKKGCCAIFSLKP